MSVPYEGWSRLCGCANDLMEKFFSEKWELENLSNSVFGIGALSGSYFWVESWNGVMTSLGKIYENQSSSNREEY